MRSFRSTYEGLKQGLGVGILVAEGLFRSTYEGLKLAHVDALRSEINSSEVPMRV